VGKALLDFSENVSLKPFNTLALDTHAHYFASVKSTNELAEALTFADHKNLPTLMIGGGSNLVLASDYEGVVLHNALRGIEFDIRGDDVLVTAAAGENWHQLVMLCLSKGYYGLQNLALIPGSVGAAPIQNIGAYGVELVSLFESLRGWDPGAKDFRQLNAEQCQFGYRDSIFKHALKGRFYITEVTLRLSTRPTVSIGYRALRQKLFELGVEEPTPQQVAEAVMLIRGSKLPDPAELPNAGSFFKNPLISKKQFDSLFPHYPAMVHYPQDDGRVKLAAGWLLEKAGWKGRQMGHVGMHTEQSIVLVNYGDGSGADVLSLAAQIQQDIKDKFGIALEIEPSIY
jgi:UDP-N-acetylmuramate dehydrogenase